MFRAITSVLAAIALVCALVLTGCGSSSAGATLSESVDGESANAMVTSVDGNTVTVQLMTGGPGGEGGQPPSGEAPSGDSSTGDQGNGQPPAMPSGDSSSSDSSSSNQDSASSDNQPPAAPSGDGNASSDSSTGDQGNGQPPAMPSGDSNSNSDQGNGQGGQPGGMGGTEATLTINDESIIYTSSDGTETQGSLSDITEGSMLTLTVSGTDVTKIVVGGGMGQGGQPGGMGQGSSEVNNGTGATTYDSDKETSGETYSSTATDENAVRTENGATVSLTDATVTKTGDSSSSEDSDFYGLNAGVLAYDESNLTVQNATITTDSAGSNGIFAYGEGTEVTVSDTTINTSKGNSGGIEVSGGATLVASNLTVDTQGESSAAIRSDRGGGTETVSGGTYTTHGKNSPAIYCTADVTVSDATLTAENSEGIVIEGKNSVTLNNDDVTGNVNGTTTRTGVCSNVMIYQSMSGDADEGTGNFTMTGGTFTATNGTLFYVTNTDAVISLTGVDIQNSGDSLMTIAGNDGVWGNSGSNGGTVDFTAAKQTLAGDITVDENSSLTLKLTDGSSYEGAINTSGQAGEVNVELDGSTWTLTGDAYVTSLSGDTDGIDLNGHTLYVNGKAWSK